MLHPNGSNGVLFTLFRSNDPLHPSLCPFAGVVVTYLRHDADVVVVREGIALGGLETVPAVLIA